MPATTSLRRLLFLIFVCSGFGGLIYESVWSHYLKLVLGHAAHAQTLVLVIFMGGMALGAWLASRVGHRIRNVLLAYALAEAVVGLLALAFHPLFLESVRALHAHVIPSLDSPAAVTASKWCLAVLLVGPQSVMLGTTFPMMSVGVMRLFPGTSGSTLAMLYFSNSIGAAAGVLVSGFVLVPGVGLPATMRLAAAVNLVVALAVWAIARDHTAPAQAPIATTESAGNTPLLLVAGAGLTGAASFFYEVGWIRMLSQVLGSTSHAFELMLSAFITGLALGSLYIRSRIGRIRSPLAYAGYVQVLMGALALSTVVLYPMTFDAMAFLMKSLPRDENGYLLFHLGSHAIALAIMLPATLMAGMTLPLFTQALLERGRGEASVGRIYAVNTVGAIAGVAVAVHVVMPALGTSWLIGLGGLLDVLLGLAFLFAAPDTPRRRSYAVGAASLVLFAIVLGTFQQDLRRTASGVYRQGRAQLHEVKFVFHRDGKTASIDAFEDRDGTITLSTNGKPDASARVPPPGTRDDATMLVAAALPLALHPAPRHVANIGFGSGMTTHALLAASALERVDSVEIEPAVIEAARFFGALSARAYEDPRSRIYIEDAKTFLSGRRQRYDLLVSEPSNPWVSGIASLFSVEFYREVKRYLAEGALLVQWLQLYETNLDSMASVFKALDAEFEDYVVYSPNDMDILILASADGRVSESPADIFREPAIAADLARIELRGVADLKARRLASRALLSPLFAQSPAPINSDYAPYLGYQAARARFLGQNIALSALHLAPVPVLELLDGVPRVGMRPITETPHFTLSLAQGAARRMARALSAGADQSPSALPPVLAAATRRVVDGLVRCTANESPAVLGEALRIFAAHTGALLPREQAAPIWQTLSASPCAAATAPPVRARLALHYASASRDLSGLLAAAERMLRDPALSEAEREHALIAGLVAALRLGPRGRALAFFKAHATTVRETMTMRLLLSHALAGA